MSNYKLNYEWISKLSMYELKEIAYKQYNLLYINVFPKPIFYKFFISIPELDDSRYYLMYIKHQYNIQLKKLRRDQKLKELGI